MTAYKRLGILCIGCALWGWICGGMDNVPLSYLLGIIGGLSMWYLLFGDVL